MTIVKGDLIPSQLLRSGVRRDRPRGRAVADIGLWWGYRISAILVSAGILISGSGYGARAEDRIFPTLAGIWADERRGCDSYQQHLDRSQNISDLLPQADDDEEGNYYVLTGNYFEIMHEAREICHFVNEMKLGDGNLIGFECGNEVMSDISKYVIYAGINAESVDFIPVSGIMSNNITMNKCISLKELGNISKRFWTVESAHCSAVADYGPFKVTFSRSGSSIKLNITGKMEIDTPGELFAALVQVDNATPMKAPGKVTSSGVSIDLRTHSHAHSLLARGVNLSLWTERSHSAHGALVRMPFLQLPLLGSGSALSSLKDCG